MCSLDSAMSPKISIICEGQRQEIGVRLREKLDHIGYTTEIQWQEDEGQKTSFYGAAAIVVCISTTNSNSLHLVPEIERAAYLQIPIIAVVVDQDFDPNDQGWMSILQLIKARAVVDFNRDKEFDSYFEELFKQWTRNVPEKDRAEKGTDVKDEDFQEDEKEEADDEEDVEDKDENIKDEKEVDEDDSLNPDEKNEGEVEKEDVVTAHASGEDDEEIEKGQKEGEEIDEVGTKESGGEKLDEKDTEQEDPTYAHVTNTEDSFSNAETLANEETRPLEDIHVAADGCTAPNDGIDSTDDTLREETIRPSEDNEQDTAPDEYSEPDSAHDEGTAGGKDISSTDVDVSEEDNTPVEPTDGPTAATGWEYPGKGDFAHFNSVAEFKESGKGPGAFHQTEPDEKVMTGDVFSTEEGEPFLGENAAA